ncbi:alpha/beta hydrolase [Limnoglobus roseus]|uniref:Alpha/beta hydrolase n=1 Tax=Limnoglobus roseus TaxID=2598579 RepID=A0A5C1AE03_9BACT|nr:alpha/beta hydrolase [Limnoglobus roseus]QEL15942.1 alpha/beta hydrolase [Limnoglobus roseus]
MLSRLVLAVVAIAAVVPLLPAQTPEFTRTEDVIYGRKFGLAMTLDVFTPKGKKNGAAVIMVISGGWYSAHEGINVGFFAEMLKRGYTVFAVVHGSQPKFTIPEVLDDMHRATRFVRSNAKKYEFDPDRIGIMGASAGGHLSLMQGTAFKPGNEKAKDPLEQISSKANAVGCFFPPTDFLNYGKEGELALGDGVLKGFRAPFYFMEADPRGGFKEITDEAKRKEIGKAISPAYHVSKDSAPSLIIHGDADKLVPIQQAEVVIAKFKEKNVPCELVVKKGKEHGWPGIDKDIITIADWFDKYLPAK